MLLDALLCLTVAFAAAASAVAGFGFSLLCGPALSLAFGAAAGVPVVNALSALTNTMVLAQGRRLPALRDVALLVLPAAATLPLAVFAARHVSPAAALIGGGAITLASTAVVGAGVRATGLAGWPGLLGAGATSAVMNAFAGVSGPPVAMYAVNAGWDADRARLTMQGYFLCLNVLTLTGTGLPRLTPALWSLAGALAVGSAVGTLLRSRVPGRALRGLVLVLAAGGGVAAIARGVLLAL